MIRNTIEVVTLNVKSRQFIDVKYRILTDLTAYVMLNLSINITFLDII